jgi:hypothetical protein
MTQKELAAYAGTSTWSVQAIELGRLKLSESLAFRISQATGVDYAWLLENDLSRPPVNKQNAPYSEADLIRAQDKSLKQERMTHMGGKLELTQAYFLLRLVWEKVAKNSDELSFFLFRLKQFVESELRRIPALQEAHLPRESEVDIPVSETSGGQLEIIKVSSYPTLFPVTPRSFDLMESDAYECREDLKEHRVKEAARLKDPETQEQRSAKWDAIADKPSLLAVPRYPVPSPTTKSVTAKPPGQKKSRRASK